MSLQPLKIAGKNSRKIGQRKIAKGFRRFRRFEKLVSTNSQVQQKVEDLLVFSR
jgi:hypothetical protein